MPRGSILAMTAATLALGASVAFAALRLGGLSTFLITGGSMEPAIPVGSMVFVQPVAPDALRAQDVVTYTLDGRTRTHRIVEVNPDGSFTTRGDANQVNDPEHVTFAGRAGLVRAHVPWLGYFMNSWRQNALYAGIALGAACVALFATSLTPRRRLEAALEASRRGDRGTAIRLLAGVVKHRPLDLVAHRRLGAALFNAGRLEDARLEYGRFTLAARLAGQEGLAEQELAYAQSWLGEARAVTALRRVA